MKKNYIRMWDYRIRNTLGNIRVVDFKTSHVRTFFSTRHTGCTRLGENNVNPKVMQYVMGGWMSGGDPFSTDRSGAKNIRMHRSK